MTSQHHILPRLQSKLRLLFATGVIAFACQAAAAMTATRTDTARVTVFFHINKSTILPDYMHNGQNLDEFVQRINAYAHDPHAEVSQIEIIGSASPDGGFNYNRSLSRKRAAALALYLRQHLDVPADKFVEMESGIDWAGMSMLVEMSDMPHRQQVLEILQSNPQLATTAEISDYKKSQLQQLDGGATWRWLLKNIFPRMRMSTTEVTCVITTNVEPTEQKETIEEAAVAEIEEQFAQAIDTIAASPQKAAADTIKAEPIYKKLFKNKI